VTSAFRLLVAAVSGGSLKRVSIVVERKREGIRVSVSAHTGTYGYGVESIVQPLKKPSAMAILAVCKRRLMNLLDMLP
jgi:hypothetical protein